MLKWYRIVIGLSSSAAAYLKPSVQATRELPKPKSDSFSMSAAASTNVARSRASRRRVDPHATISDDACRLFRKQLGEVIDGDQEPDREGPAPTDSAYDGRLVATIRAPKDVTKPKSAGIAR
jgi:hypothetical protein